MKPLSKEAKSERRPLPPEVLANALQTRVHIDRTGKGRAAKTPKRK